MGQGVRDARMALYWHVPVSTSKNEHLSGEYSLEFASK